MTTGGTLTGQLWELLDAATERFMGLPKEERDTPDALKAAGEARGLSNAIHVMCQPHFDTGTDVAKLAIKRMKARQAGEDMPSTPGDMSDAEAQAATVAREAETSAQAAAKKAAPKRATKSKPAPAQAEAELAPEDSRAEEGAEDADLRKELASLNQSQIKQIANGLRCDFEPSKLAELYKVSTAAIEHIRDDMK